MPNKAKKKAITNLSDLNKVSYITQLSDLIDKLQVFLKAIEV